MNQRLTIRLPKEMARHLDEAARKRMQPRSAMVRLALAQFLESQSDVRRINRVCDLLGSINSGVPDLGQRHRDNIIERIHDSR